MKEAIFGVASCCAIHHPSTHGCCIRSTLPPPKRCGGHPSACPVLRVTGQGLSGPGRQTPCQVTFAESVLVDMSQIAQAGLTRLDAAVRMAFSTRSVVKGRTGISDEVFRPGMCRASTIAGADWTGGALERRRTSFPTSNCTLQMAWKNSQASPKARGRACRPCVSLYSAAP